MASTPGGGAELERARLLANVVVLGVLVVALPVVLLLGAPSWLWVFVVLMLLGTAFAALRAWRIWRVARARSGR